MRSNECGAGRVIQAYEVLVRNARRTRRRPKKRTIPAASGTDFSVVCRHAARTATSKQQRSTRRSCPHPDQMWVLSAIPRRITDLVA